MKIDQNDFPTESYDFYRGARWAEEYLQKKAQDMALQTHNLETLLRMMKTDLAAAESELRELRLNK